MYVRKMRYNRKGGQRKILRPE